MTGYRFGFILSLLAMTSMAEAVDINISGKVTASPCTVDTQSVSKEVELPKLQTHSLEDAGTGGDWVNFSLDLNNCPESTSQASATFTGTADAKDATAYKNTGTATNIALQLAAQNQTSTLYGNGSTMKVDIDASTHKATFPLAARMYTPEGGVSQGTFVSVVNVSFTYQ
ncbi:fimbrial protein [Enterobacter mori]|uniref:fimbrial protein n=1 Tax=Enterobacter mori TaxID=539813 RepID=UPI001B8C4929|nr:fimbrial protein [Enterobacter mori]MBS3045962.1 type 1 fimbrial protein [Enterobacter mori]